MEAAFAATGAFNEKLHADGYWVFAGGLQAASTATVVDGQGETPVMTDGPYLETKEVIGGFWVIDAPDLDVALKLAAEGSKACRGKVEVRRSKASPEPAADRSRANGGGRDAHRRSPGVGHLKAPDARRTHMSRADTRCWAGRRQWSARASVPAP